MKLSTKKNQFRVKTNLIFLDAINFNGISINAEIVSQLPGEQWLST
jgi:hypothetical protein